MTSAYGVFATEGIRYEPQAVLRIEDANGKILEEFSPKGGQRVLEENVARQISDILSDNNARIPLLGANSFLNFGSISVTGKTGTTNNNKDAWMMGYTPNIAVGVWSGNNDNTPMKKGSAISGRLWREFMDIALKKLPRDSFNSPEINTSLSLKPVLRGVWQGGESVFIDEISGKLATEWTPEETKKELVPGKVHSTLYWINRDDILGEAPGPQTNQQYINWETATQNWWQENKNKYTLIDESQIPSGYDNIHTEENQPEVLIKKPEAGAIYDANNQVTIEIDYKTKFPVRSVDVFINDTYLATKKSSPFVFTFIPKDIENIGDTNEIKVILRDEVYNKTEATTEFMVDL